MERRRFTEREVKQILEKAVDDGFVESPVPSDGLTLEEIQQIGAEVGIDAGALERAARSVGVQMPEGVSRLAGGAVSIHAERRTIGSLDTVSTGEVLSVIRRGMGRPGELSEVGGLLQWRSRGELIDRAITLSSEEGVTAITGSGDLREAAAVTFVPAGIVSALVSLVGFIQSVDGGSEIGMVLAVLILPAVFLVLRTIFGRVSRAESSRLERVIEELSRLVGETAVPDPNGSA